MVGESDEEVFANEDELDLNEDEASVLCRAESKSWSMNRDQKRQQRKDRQLIDRLTIASWRFQLRDWMRSLSVTCVESADIGIASFPSHHVRDPWSCHPSHILPRKAEVAAVSNHAVLAADDKHNFVSLTVGNALIDTVRVRT